MACRKRIQQRLALYQGVCPIYMQFSDDAEETFTNALALLQLPERVRLGLAFVLLEGGAEASDEGVEAAPGLAEGAGAGGG
ncbi:hypothetical protein RJ640_023161 [Escallonia rubra]|uniref:Uncharacterized protein n=1 Tax=Escallonia rubra TaxID=112253 RepID=A0AA88UQ58_9ASTE|nr:hypothetical protein RJ640_023161 [Escallonia rubra]